MVRKNAEEIRALLIQHNFSAADKDGSGVISKAELSLMMYLAFTTLSCFYIFFLEGGRAIRNVFQHVEIHTFWVESLLNHIFLHSAAIKQCMNSTETRGPLSSSGGKMRKAYFASLVVF